MTKKKTAEVVEEFASGFVLPNYAKVAKKPPSKVASTRR